MNLAERDAAPSFVTQCVPAKADGQIAGFLARSHVSMPTEAWTSLMVRLSGEGGHHLATPLAAISNERKLLNFAVRLWSGSAGAQRQPPLLPTGDSLAPEYHFAYVHSTPTRSYSKYLYHYSQCEHSGLAAVADVKPQRDASRLLTGGTLVREPHFGVSIEYARASSEDLLIQISIVNRGTSSASLHVAPTLWFARTWSSQGELRPMLKEGARTTFVVRVLHPRLDSCRLYAEGPAALVFSGMEVDAHRSPQYQNARVRKDRLRRCRVQDSRTDTIYGCTETSAYYPLTMAGGDSRVVRLRLCASHADPFGADFDVVMNGRRCESTSTRSS